MAGAFAQVWRICDHLVRTKGRLLTGVKQARDRKTSGKKAGKPRAPANEAELPFADSVGYQVRTTHRALQRFLQFKIEPHGITTGMWYFLRALWHEDGLTQRELSVRVGTMEPTTLSAILVMEKKGLVRRVRNPVDRRKWHIHLTPKGRAAKARLLPLARGGGDTAVQNLSRGDVTQLLKNLGEVQKSLYATLARLDGANNGTVE